MVEMTKIFAEMTVMMKVEKTEMILEMTEINNSRLPGSDSPLEDPHPGNTMLTGMQ